MSHEVIISGRFYGDKCFPSLNDYLREIGSNPKAGGRFKKKYEMLCCNAIRRCLKRWKPKGMITLHYKFYEPKKGVKRDHMNIFCAADKIFQDALQMCDVIKNDSPKFVDGSKITHEFFYIDSEPKIVVEIEEMAE